MKRSPSVTLPMSYSGDVLHTYEKNVACHVNRELSPVFFVFPLPTSLVSVIIRRLTVEVRVLLTRSQGCVTAWYAVDLMWSRPVFTAGLCASAVVSAVSTWWGITSICSSVTRMRQAERCNANELVTWAAWINWRHSMIVKKMDYASQS